MVQVISKKALRTNEGQRGEVSEVKINEMNKVLLNLCKDVNIPFISHSAIDTKKDFNNSKLYLNIKVLGNCRNT